MKQIVIIILILFMGFFSFSQSKIISHPQIYKDTTGKIFVNKSLPLYFKISESIEPNAQRKLLISHTTPNTTNPVYLANEGLNIFYSPWAVDTVSKKTVYPKQNVSFEIYADSKPPETKIVNNLTSYDKSDTLYFGANLKITFSSSDNLSGISQTYISINQAPYEEYLHDTLIFEHGVFYVIKYYSIDNTGNDEPEKEVSFTIDTTRPLTNLVIIGNHQANIVGPDCKVTLKPQDAFSGAAKTYYYIDNQPKKIYSAPINVGVLNEGRHVLNYYTQDNVNNVEDVKSYEFYIDRTPPMVIDEIVGDFVYINGQAYTSGRSQMQISAIDNKSGVKAIYYSLDKQNWQVYDNPFFLPSGQDNVAVYYYAEDNVGNKTPFDLNSTSSNKYFTSQMDLEPPIVKYRLTDPYVKLFDTLFVSPKTNIILSATDDLAGVKNITYQIDGGQNFDYADKFSISEPGYHKISVFCFDQVNNMGNADFFVKVDSTPPEIFVNFSYKSFLSNKKLVYPKGTKLFIAATDFNTGVKNIYYQINNSSEKLYSGFLVFSDSGEYTLNITAIDNINNKIIKSYIFYIE
ncbi:MAG: hypothetical protein JXR68_10705 [Bacteroidales bacterium]|nr:hypothetical protein [Bacteroidales bacterium]